MSAANVRPFPWGALDATSRLEVEALRALRSWSTTRVRAADVARALATLLDARIDVIVRRAGPSSAATPLDGVAVVLAPADDAKIARGLVVEADGALAAALIARAVRRPAATIVDAARPSTPSIAGAFGAIASAVARRVHAGAPLRVLAAGPSSAILRDLARLAPELVAVELTVLVDDDAHLARLLVPRATTLVASPPRWDAARLAALADMPIEMAIVACVSATTAEEVALLAPGDAWAPGAWPLARTETGAWTGPLFLSAPSTDFGVGADLGEDGRLVLRGEVTPLDANEDAGDDMKDSKKDALVDAVGEVPVVVRVEIGAARMRAREWAELSKGDVVALGRRIADPVVLRVGGVEVARGELVDLDGEVAVRIVDRIDGKETGS